MTIIAIAREHKQRREGNLNQLISVISHIRENVIMLQVPDLLFPLHKEMAHHALLTVNSLLETIDALDMFN